MTVLWIANPLVQIAEVAPETAAMTVIVHHGWDTELPWHWEQYDPNDKNDRPVAHQNSATDHSDVE
ncbi:MAG: hypothetical protein H6936_02485 [Burkholderiales bacterium]|nr:hypothetical protein [Nitrosomonas sp.]MCP5273721.1 hypothetical protein [Burkholderiales bacterium]